MVAFAHQTATPPRICLKYDLVCPVHLIASYVPYQCWIILLERPVQRFPLLPDTSSVCASLSMLVFSQNRYRTKLTNWLQLHWFQGRLGRCCTPHVCTWLGGHCASLGFGDPLCTGRLQRLADAYPGHGCKAKVALQDLSAKLWLWQWSLLQLPSESGRHLHVRPGACTNSLKQIQGSQDISYIHVQVHAYKALCGCPLSQGVSCIYVQVHATTTSLRLL